MIYLVIVIALLCGLLGFEKFQSGKERNKLINALVSRTPEQMAMLETVDKTKPAKQKDQPIDLIPEDSLNQEQLEELIKKKIV
jgi:hypothetical protein